MLRRTSDAEGRFAFAGAPAGRYLLGTQDGAAQQVLRAVALVAGREEDLGDVALP